MELAFDRTSNCQEVGYVARRRIVDSPNTKSVAFHKEKPLQLDRMAVILLEWDPTQSQIRNLANNHHL